MTYVLSDIHGELDRWQAMLERIGFSEEDTLYVLGDCMDRKPHGVEVLREVMTRPNVRLILGNHEKLCLDSFWGLDPQGARRLWKYNGGGSTDRVMRYKLTYAQRTELLRFLKGLPDHLDITVNGREFHLVHGFVGEDTHSRIWGRPEPPPTEPPIPGKTVIVGHTCTCWLHEQTPGWNPGAPFTIFHAPGFIAIDCGCGNQTENRRLACLRLEDMAEFYV